MSCAIETEKIRQTIQFHGHNCPGLTIGIRTAELALSRLDIANMDDWVCVTETDMCAVDAIQFLTGCTFGKGNLIHKDFGKSVFTFFDRKPRKGFRALFKDNSKDAKQEMGKEERIEALLAADLKDLFRVAEIDAPPVSPARILKSISCDACREATMDSRIRLFDGQHFCFPCFEKIEQKI